MKNISLSTNMLGFADLHIHTSFSDGIFHPLDIVRQAKYNGLKAIAITDHDCVDGVVPAIKAGEDYGVEVIPGIEISTDYDNELHILGYFIDVCNPILIGRLKQLADENFRRTYFLLREFKKANINIPINDLVRKYGFINRDSMISYLLDSKIVKSEEEAICNFFSEDKTTNIKMKKLFPQEGIEIIKEAKGIPVLAHPGRIGLPENELSLLVQDLIRIGLEGIECWHPDNNGKITSYCLQMAKKLDLLTTGGSDFHGNNRKNHLLDQSNGIPYGNVQKLKVRIQENR